MQLGQVEYASVCLRLRASCLSSSLGMSLGSDLHQVLSYNRSSGKTCMWHGC